MAKIIRQSDGMLLFITLAYAKQEFIFKWIVWKDWSFNFKSHHAGEIVSLSVSPGQMNDETRKWKSYFISFYSFIRALIY